MCSSSNHRTRKNLRNLEFTNLKNETKIHFKYIKANSTTITYIKMVIQTQISSSILTREIFLAKEQGAALEGHKTCHQIYKGL